MAYVLVQNGVVVQKQTKEAEGFIQAPNNVTCGFLYDGSNFVAPTVVPPPSQDEVDTTTLNEALTAPGTVTRALGEILFGVIKGTISVTPSITKAQFVTMLKNKMRNGN